MKNFVICSLGALALAACGDKPADAPADDGKGARGEVLGGTISDAMIPLDTVTSQSPPLREAGTSGTGSTGSAAPAGGATDAPVAAEPEPAPAEAPEGAAETG